MRIFLIGFMGCGKTTAGKKLAQELKLGFIDLDSFIEQKHSSKLSDIFEKQGEKKFRQLEQSALISILESDNIIVATGGGTPCFRNNMELMNNNGYTIYINMTPEDLVKRLEKLSTSRPLLKNKTGKQLLDYISDTLTAREKYYLQSKSIVDGNNINIYELVKLVWDG